MRSVLGILVLVAACSNGETQLVVQSTPERPVLAEFVGHVSFTEGTVTIDSVFGSTMRGLDPTNTVQDGFPNQGPARSLELVTTRVGSGPGECLNYDNSICGDIQINTFYNGTLGNVHAQITSMIPVTGHEGLNSDPVYDGLSDLLGLWSYGDIPGRSSATRTWVFGAFGGGDFTFRGAVWADVPLPASCNEILLSGESTGDGQYLIDPDGFGGVPAFTATCDMTLDGGGWTLIGNEVWWSGMDDAVPPNTRLTDPTMDAVIASSDNLYRAGIGLSLFVEDLSRPLFDLHYWRSASTSVQCTIDYTNVVFGSMVTTNVKQVSCDPDGFGFHNCGSQNGWILFHSHDTYNFDGGHPCAFGLGEPTGQGLRSLWIR